MENKIKMLDPMMDFVFKALFGKNSEVSKRLLIALLNDILSNTEEEIIKSITHLNPFNYKDFETDKLSILDIKAKTEKGEIINIEIQVKDHENYRERSLYYWSKSYAESMKESKSYESLKKTISVNIMGYNIIKESNKIHNKFKVLEEQEHFPLTEDLEIHYLELPKLPDKKIEDLKGIELWLYFLKEAGKENNEKKLKELKGRSEIMEVLLDELEEISADDKIREIYRTREKTKLDRIAEIRYAERKGREEGREEGIELGMEEGELKKSIDIARNMLIGGMDQNLVVEFTKLSKEKVEEIKNEILK